MYVSRARHTSISKRALYISTVVICIIWIDGDALLAVVDFWYSFCIFLLLYIDRYMVLCGDDIFYVSICLLRVHVAASRSVWPVYVYEPLPLLLRPRRALAQRALLRAPRAAEIRVFAASCS